jgi:hypothetical protein
LTYRNGTHYEGEFFESKKSGFGKFGWPDGSYYEGSWICDKIEGWGRYVWGDGRVFKGKWVENNMMGYGELTWPGEEKKYTGDFINGKYDGVGKLVLSSESCYVGEWLKGYPDGIGSWIKTGGRVLKGEFSKGKFVQEVDEVNKVIEEFIDYIDGEDQNNAMIEKLDQPNDEKLGDRKFRRQYTGSFHYHKMKESIDRRGEKDDFSVNLDQDQDY